MRILKYKIEREFASKNIKTYLYHKCGMSSSLIKHLKSYEDGICVNGERKKVNYVLCEGDELVIKIYEDTSENIAPVKLEFEIVYEDEDIMIINKPPHMPTHPSVGNHDNTLANALMYYFKEKGEEFVFRAVNRLDKDTSGLMCVAKNAYAHHILIEQMKDKILNRLYTAVICGVLEGSGTIDAPIRRSGDSIIKREVGEGGREAITHFDVLENFENHTLIKLRLETGRTHQIRVHMAHIGCPLVGDWLYGTEDKNIGRYLLQSSSIELIHPVSGQKISFGVELDKDMQNFIENISQKH